MEFGRTTSAMLMLSRVMRRHNSAKILRAHSTARTSAMLLVILTVFICVLTLIGSTASTAQRRHRSAARRSRLRRLACKIFIK